VDDTYLEKTDFHTDPFAQFALWFADAQQSSCALPHAMTLATADATGQPTARMVLLKDCDERGFSFYTNLASAKARDLQQNPRAALVFHWEELRRQVRATGPVERISAPEADAYFASRPRGSQLGAWASPQSEVLESRGDLQRAIDQLAAALGRLSPIGRMHRVLGLASEPPARPLCLSTPCRPLALTAIGSVKGRYNETI
jgi:pyridoxamine 5'-phosphate oxidase